MRGSPRLALCAFLLVLCAGTARAQDTGGPAGLKCGSRAPVRYAVVFDASSSLRRHHDDVVEAYTRLLRVLSEALCEGDPPMQVFAFPTDGDGHMHNTLRLSPGDGQRELARQVARQLLGATTPHSDLPLVLRSIARDVHAADVVFIVTDGSYYPRDLRGGRMSLDAVRDSLDALARQAADPRLFVIGVRSEHEPALDPALRRRLSPQGDGDWHWHSGTGSNVQLDTAHGGAMLHALFGARYQPIEELSLPRFLFADGHGAWLRAAGYQAGAGLRISDLRGVRLEHFVAEPWMDSATVPCPRDPAFPTLQTRRANAYGPREFCSIQAPDEATLERLSRVRWTRFAYLQAGIPGFDSLPGNIYGYHQLVLPAESGTCSPSHVERYLGDGRAWPASVAETGWIRLVRLSDRTAETIGLVPLPGTGCLVAGGRAGTALRDTGDHLLYASVGGHVAVKQVHLDAPRLSWQPELRFWSGGFPPSNAAWLHVCAGLSSPLNPDERLQLTSGGRTFELRPPGDKKCWAHGSRHPGHVFSSIIAVDGIRSSGYLTVSRAGTGQRTSSEIYPVVKQGRGHFLLPLWLAALLFSGSCLMQILFWVQQHYSGRRWQPASAHEDAPSTSQIVLRGTITLFRAGTLPLIVAEIGIVVFVTDRTGNFGYLGPSIMIASVIYAAKLWVGFLLPEFVTDELTA